MRPFGVNVVLVVEPGIINTEWAPIAADNLLKTSGKTAYRETAIKKSEWLRKFKDNKTVSEPEVVAKCIVKILGKRNPKFRYPIGGGAKRLMLVRRLTTDKTFYKLINKVTG